MKPIFSQWRFTIRKKLLLVTAVLLVIPWIGYQYINEMENYLRSELEAELLNRVKVVAAVLHDRPKLFANKTPTYDIPPTQINKHIYVRPLRSPIQLDGYDDEWDLYQDRILTFDKQDDYLNIAANPATKFNLQIGSYQRYLYCLLKVTDPQVIYRQANSLRLDRNDHILLAMENNQGEYVRYAITTLAPGWINGQLLQDDYQTGRAKKAEYRIKGEWQTTATGYNVEFRLPLSMLGNKIAFAVADVNDPNTRNIEALIASAEITDLTTLGTMVVPSPEVETLLQRLKRKSSRTWVLDNNYRVIALTGNLTDSREPAVYRDALTTPRPQRSFLSGVMHLFYQLVLTQPATRFVDDLSAASRLDTEEVDAALTGKPATGWRRTPDNQVNIITATHPIYSGDDVVGAVAIEETTNNILLMQNQAMEILINLSILSFGIAAIVLLGFASRLSLRVKKLRDAAELAISHDGKVQGDIGETNANDEIGDLHRSIADMLNRLSQYNRYLETMASKLAHELRTPITVVRSSLENIDTGLEQDESSTYVARAREGINRLSNILTRMSEATRLEQTLQQETLDDFNLADVVEGCVEGYRMANTDSRYRYNLHGDKTNYRMHGSAELIAQLLDKLVANANEFATPETDIIINLQTIDKRFVLHVSNQGPLLPEQMHQQLFDSMVSVRDKRGDQPHLGLGLYIVRLISEFHRGNVRAYNSASNNGVVFEVSFPAA